VQVLLESLSLPAEHGATPLELRPAAERRSAAQQAFPLSQAETGAETEALIQAARAAGRRGERSAGERTPTQGECAWDVWKSCER
jgi:hypothetical protein